MRVYAALGAAVAMSCGSTYYDSARCKRSCNGQPLPDLEMNHQFTCTTDSDQVMRSAVAACQQDVTDCAQPTCGCTLYLSTTYDCKGLNE
jgi:hypothetical protein